MKQESQDCARLDALRYAVDRWLSRGDVNRNAVALEFLEVLSQLDFAEVSFSEHPDLYERSRAVAQKLFRWLGSDEHVSADLGRLFQIEALLVEALPADIRLDYLSRVYPSVMVATRVVDDLDTLALRQPALDLVSRQNASQQALLDYVTEPSHKALAMVVKDVAIANAAGSHVLGVVKNIEAACRFCFARGAEKLSLWDRFGNWLMGIWGSGNAR